MSETTVIPPGLEGLGQLEHHASGGAADTQWRDIQSKRYYNTSVVVAGQKILLGRKKRGWGIDKYNGFGGKVEPGESPLEAATRELKEEAGIDAVLKHAGTLVFLTSSVEWAFHIDIYRADSWTGEITESEEMAPEWFSTTATPGSDSTDSAGLPPIPYDKMWETDSCWLPLLLSNQRFAGRADFVGEKDKSKPYKWWYGVVRS